MKTLRIFAIFLLLLVAYNCISVHAKPGFASKNLKDTLDYKLYIDETRITPLNDTMFGAPAVKCFIARCPLTLTNNSNETLRYLTMSASWWDSYSLDNRNFVLAADYWNVFKNGPQVHVLLPHQSETRNIPIVTYKSYYRGQKVRIAMKLKKDDPFLVPGQETIIWSNEVAIP